MSRRRTEVPSKLAARVLFEHDRTCCVCRVRAKPVQLHHLDEDPTNHSRDNLAVLCLDCHRETQLRGGFDRKLDADQLQLYRADWWELVRQQRARAEAVHELREQPSTEDIQLATSIAEVYRENEAFDLLAIHYDVFGNDALRDKYIELALARKPSDQTAIFLRELQGRVDLIPPRVISRTLARYAADRNWTERARLLGALGRHAEALSDYLSGIQESLEEGNLFSAGFYLREAASGR